MLNRRKFLGFALVAPIVPLIASAPVIYSPTINARGADEALRRELPRILAAANRRFKESLPWVH